MGTTSGYEDNCIGLIGEVLGKTIGRYNPQIYG
jgi:hypothetical protein